MHLLESYATLIEWPSTCLGWPAVMMWCTELLFSCRPRVLGSEMVVLDDNELLSRARCVRGGLRYRWNALLFHLPNSLIWESGMLSWAAVVAASDRKLWSEKPDATPPIWVMIDRRLDTNRGLVNGAPNANKNRGPGAFPIRTSHCSMAATGQSSSLVLPSRMSVPLQNGSVLDDFRCIRVRDGFW